MVAHLDLPEYYVLLDTITSWGETRHKGPGAAMPDLPGGVLSLSFSG